MWRVFISLGLCDLKLLNIFENLICCTCFTNNPAHSHIKCLRAIEKHFLYLKKSMRPDFESRHYRTIFKCSIDYIIYLKFQSIQRKNQSGIIAKTEK